LLNTVGYTGEMYDSAGNKIADVLTGLITSVEYNGGIGMWTLEDSLWTQPKPDGYPSWVLNEETRLWQPPVTYPEDSNSYSWDENTVSWVENSFS
jgi:hypothetical protein